jgi:hydrogenase expression/formation protein HypD
MKYLDEYRDAEIGKKLIRRIQLKAAKLNLVKIMEVCGTHTMAIARYGLRKVLPENIQLISGPGCPVCVTPNHFLDKAIALARQRDVIMATFGDMMRVPGSSSSLEKERAAGFDIRIVYSTLDALEIALKNDKKKVIFLGVGFETTIPTVAASIIKTEQLKLNNYFVLAAHKTMPVPMEMLAAGDQKSVPARKMKLDGFICPAHVSAIIGSKPYTVLAEKYRKACVIAGFEPLDILEGIDMILDQIIKNEPKVEIQYSRVVQAEGNPVALKIIFNVFETCDSEWRGIGIIPKSGLKLRDKYSKFDADKIFDVKVEPARENKGCLCGKVMQGIVTPLDCKLFAKVCTPENPIGACMVSSEGTCAAWYKYERR